MGNIRNGLVEMRSNNAAGFSECIAAVEGRIDGLWLIIAADLASAKHLHGGAIRRAVMPYELLDRSSLRPSMVSAGGVVPGKDRQGRPDRQTGARRRRWASRTGSDPSAPSRKPSFKHFAFKDFAFKDFAFKDLPSNIQSQPSPLCEVRSRTGSPEAVRNICR
ncbi:hypothetical protein QMZ05_30715 [Bradyrhizobium sp. INPA03-11B]|uniref:hypothetical protein n=1 Tax=Bradyrhizobium sp. INPA03-11B TaxID=418598 RepID=UPI00338EB1A8